ncbi:DUF1385 domain-containing protein [Eggerthella sinensis]|uniref:DUF1385 domain-containing protein n=1 Tax=Eggerthella sinensis TaxID=242230 RepID=A0A3N0IYR3_9ACTN|nr:DUF1385 domain-containing protein [Eggerthella sinensis]RDB65920.1 DUF1385 domain-containing protein [Eggerthella sinensis]RNM41856.1 DUF1385 domain-containing protein [Eggerthella sinensis]
MAEQKSDLSRAFSEDGALKTHVGGQALIEGIMMRGKYNWSVAVREPSGGIYVEEHDLASGRNKNGWMHWPLVRGCRALVESLVLGYKALEIAAMHAFGEEDAADEPVPRSVAAGELVPHPIEADEPASHPSAPADGLAGDGSSSAGARSGGAGCGDGDAASSPSFSWKDDFGRPDTMIDALGAQRSLEVVDEPESQPEKKSFMDEEVEFGKKEMAVSMVLGLVLGVVLFIVAPAFITNLIVGEYDSNTVLWNIVDGLLRVGVFVFYLWLIGRMQEIKRMFGYHGAEHKTIHCYEHGLPLTPENARSFPRLHVRCGTAFLIMVMVIAIFVYTITPLNGLIAAWGVPDGAPKLLLVIVVRILLMPIIAGISYEITVKWAGSHPDNPLVKVVLWPGMQMQYLTTNEPDDGQIECAIAAMQKVLEREEAEDAKAKAGSNAPANASANDAVEEPASATA